MTTAVLIADDNARVRHAWRQLLRAIPNVVASRKHVTERRRFVSRWSTDRQSF
jgi:hypothetical protein